jgi:hypothetical protein
VAGEGGDTRQPKRARARQPARRWEWMEEDSQRETPGRTMIDRLLEIEIINISVSVYDCSSKARQTQVFKALTFAAHMFMSGVFMDNGAESKSFQVQ